MKTLLHALTIFMLFSLLPSPALSQASSLSLRLERVDTTAFPQVSLQLSAWDASGLPLAGLQPGDFTLQEDGGAALHPQTLQADTQAPLWVVLVIDISGSMNGQPLIDARAAAARFLDRLSVGDHVALIAFSAPLDSDPAKLDPARELGFTTDLKPIYDLVEDLKAEGETRLYDATAKAERLFAGLPPSHRAVVLLTDGKNDPASIGDPEQPIQLAQEMDAPVFVVGLGPNIDEPYLRRLASETGGLFRAAPKSSELASLFADMATLLKTQYQLTYTSRLPADGQAHTLRVTLNKAGQEITQDVKTGPLPLIPTAPPPTATPRPSPTLVPPPTETVLPPSPTLSPPASTALPPPVEAQIAATPTEMIAATSAEKQNSVPQGTFWIGGAVLVVLLAVAGWVVLRRRKPRPPREACAKCGYNMTGRSGPCPQCGETRRLPKPK